MKKKNVFRLLACSLALLMFAPACSNAQKSAGENETLATIAERKSVRSFTSRPVSQEDVMTILRAGMAAPTGRDIRPWEFIVVNDRATLDSLATISNPRILAEAPLAIVVCGDTIASPAMWQHDTSAATQNILLAVESLGLGAVWTLAYPNIERSNAIMRILNLPSNIVPLCIIPIGYPNGEFSPKDKFNEEKIHFNGWGQRR